MVLETEIEEVAFTVRPQVTTLAQRPCTIYQEISFRTPVKLECIRFRNFYCASVTVKQLIGDAKAAATDSVETVKAEEWEWKAILENFQLMKDPHFENDAQHFHTIKASQMNDNFSHETGIQALRFYLQQPSPNWRSFGLRDLMCYTLKPKPEVLDTAIPATVIIDPKVANPELVSRVQALMNTRVRIHETLQQFGSVDANTGIAMD